MAYKHERKVVIVGKTGNGKSSLGNTLLGRSAFVEKRSFAAVTEECLAVQNETKKLTVVDTPGLFDTDGKKGNLAGQALCVLKAIEVCPHPHAFLIVLNGSVRLSEEERSTVDVLKLTFGQELLKHAVVVFTNVENCESDLSFDEELKTCAAMQDIIALCGKRVTRIDNKNAKTEHIDRIFEKVDAVSNNGARFYKSDYLSIRKQALENESSIEKYNYEPVRNQVQKMLKKMERMRLEGERRLYEERKKCEEYERRRLNWELATDIAGEAVQVASYAIFAGLKLGINILMENHMRNGWPH